MTTGCDPSGAEEKTLLAALATASSNGRIGGSAGAAAAAAGAAAAAAGGVAGVAAGAAAVSLPLECAQARSAAGHRRARRRRPARFNDNALASRFDRHRTVLP